MLFAPEPGFGYYVSTQLIPVIAFLFHTLPGKKVEGLPES